MTLNNQTDFLPSQPEGEERIRPFLSIICRTQGKRLNALQEVLTCLMAQTDLDFELLLMVHKVDFDTAGQISQLLASQPNWLTRKIKVHEVKEGNRVVPLNHGLSHINGMYFTVLDDDDLPFAHWVATFRNLFVQGNSAILRSSVVRQDVESIPNYFDTVVRAIGPLDKMYLRPFRLLENAIANYSPPSSIAYPTDQIRIHGLIFDENLDTQEDWDFFMRCAFRFEVRESQEITSIYRWWVSGTSSRTQHSDKVWALNRAYILNKFNNESPILRPGWLLDDEIVNSRTLVLDLIVRIIDGRPWKIMQFLLKPKNLIKKNKKLEIRSLLFLTTSELSETLYLIQNSRTFLILQHIRKFMRKIAHPFLRGA